ncbi:lycopene beta-cyclase CrtY [Aurantiacibacter flavus]|uniref:Lycopene beta-cyclase CrtY n=1 Tax=Aurantiacibacter flavus TaxID=3145232 RepID=A0ABV0D0A7_9SPHN
MTGHTFDIAIVGGGLAGGLIALAVTQARPDLTLRLIEAGAQPGGNHRWSWFASDLPAGGDALLAPFGKTAWNHGYDVSFPGHSRHLASRYCSLASEDFAATLARELPAGAILTGAEAASLDAGGVTLGDGRRIDARAVIDCRGFAPTASLSGGWQVFMGRHLRVSRPHGLTAPVIMDATVAQLGGYRFVYVLPLGERELFIEDTYYQDEPTLDHAALNARLDDYARTQGWDGDILGSETGVLPVITGGDFAAFQAEQRIEGVSVAGARGGFVHPLTSYTLPFAVATALAVTAEADLPGDQLATKLETMAREHWRAMGFYRLLGRMLFGAALPEERYRVFERFYRLSERLIERFYAGRSTMADRARVLAGKPPVPVSRAVAALTRPAPPLRAPEHKDYP